uniref:Uncharacterized protein n=1 Tax=Rhizophora mucronata TaxID=61149 RepID=A0A2P2PDB8_RHIMU
MSYLKMHNCLSCNLKYWLPCLYPFDILLLLYHSKDL